MATGVHFNVRACDVPVKGMAHGLVYRRGPCTAGVAPFPIYPYGLWLVLRGVPNVMIGVCVTVASSS